MKFTNAEGYNRYLGPWSAALAPLFIDFAGIRNDERVLDVGSGTGCLTLALIASKPCAEVIGIDPSAPYIEFARTRTSDSRVRFDVGDAMSLPYTNDYFDKSLAQLVLSSVPDAVHVVTAMSRVTRAGGTLATCVWASGKDNERNHLFWEAAMAVDPAASYQREPAVRYGGRGRLYALWAQCGLERIEEADLAISVEFGSFEEFWMPHLDGQGHIGAYVSGLPSHLREALRQRLRHDLLGTKEDGPFSLRAQALAISGISPS